MVKKFTDDPAFDGLNEEAKNLIEESRYLQQHVITTGVKTELIWPESETRTARDIQDILEFWLVAEGIDIENHHEYRTDGQLSTFLYEGFIFNSLIVDNPIFNHSKNLALSCYVFAPSEPTFDLLREFQLINHAGKFVVRESTQSPTGLFVHYDIQIFGEPKSLQFAIGTAMNLSISLASQLIEIWPQKFGGMVLEIDSLDEIGN